MTLLQVIRAIEKVAAQQPSVNMIVQNDVFKLNTIADARYGAFAWTQGQHSGVVSTGMMSFQFTLFFVDRLTEDESNMAEVQSTGCAVLSNILRELESYDIYVENYNLQPFSQRFLDACAGVYCSVTMEVDADSLCSETYEDKSNILIY